MQKKKYSDVISDPICYENCTCVGRVVNCVASNLNDLPVGDGSVRQPRAIFLSNNALQLTGQSFLNLHWLGRLLLEHNQLSFIPDDIFIHLSNLFELDLGYNQLELLNSRSFSDLASLQKLNLGSNRLDVLRREYLTPLQSITQLILVENSLSDVTVDVFADISSLKILRSNAFKFCCITPPGVEICTPPADEFSSCKDLMANPTLQICIWILGIISFVGNVFVVVWRILTDRQRVSSFFIINLAMSDALMGVYLLIIASVDRRYRGTYIVYSDSWRARALCQAAGILAMVSSEVSVYTLTAITADRAMSILFPLKMGQMRMKTARITALVEWLLSFFVSILPIMKIPYFGPAFFGTTGTNLILMFKFFNERSLASLLIMSVDTICKPKCST